MHCCPNCGADHSVLAPVEYGHEAITEDGSVIFDGRQVPLSRTLYAIAECIIRGRGRGIDCGVLAARLPGEVFDNSIKKYIERVRCCFRIIDPEFDLIRALHGFGAYRWQYRASHRL
jgi:DNA-binding response OmpR family regulator